MKNVEYIIEKLIELGAKPEILKNPSFITIFNRAILNYRHYVDNFNIKNRNYEVDINDILESKINVDENTKKIYINNIDSEYNTGIYLGFLVDDKGMITIFSAKKSKSENEIKNNGDITKIELLQQNHLHVEEKHQDSTFMLNNKSCYRNTSNTVSYFNQYGIEYQKNKVYKDSTNNNFSHERVWQNELETKPVEFYNTIINQATSNQIMLSDYSNMYVARKYYDTAEVTLREHVSGKVDKVMSKECPINSEHKNLKELYFNAATLNYLQEFGNKIIKISPEEIEKDLSVFKDEPMVQEGLRKYLVVDGVFRSDYENIENMLETENTKIM